MKRIARPHIRRRTRNFDAYRPNFQLHRMKWEFHLYDDDPFPSIPHGHSLKSEHKLQVYSGEIFKGKAVCGKIKNKELDRLWNDKRFVRLVEVSKKFHEAKDNKKVGHRRAAVLRIRRTRQTSSLIFISEVEMYDSELQ